MLCTYTVLLFSLFVYFQYKLPFIFVLSFLIKWYVTCVVDIKSHMAENYHIVTIFLISIAKCVCGSCCGCGWYVIPDTQYTLTRKHHFSTRTLLVFFPDYLGVQRSGGGGVCGQRGLAHPRSQDSSLPTHHLLINTETDSRVKWLVDNFSHCVWHAVSAASKQLAIYSVRAEKWCLRVCIVCRELHTNHNHSRNHMY